MEASIINNFAGGSPVQISAWHLSSDKPIVSISQNRLGMSFSHSMTPDQAREMAAALVQMANSFDEVTA